MLRSRALLIASSGWSTARAPLLLCLFASIALGAAPLARAASYFETEIRASDAAAGDQFGFALALRGATVVAGSPFDDDAGESSGSAHVFERDAGGVDNWGEAKKLVATDAAAGDGFGFAVAIDADTIVVGAPFEDGAGSSAGAVYVFERDAGGADNWGQVKKLFASDATSGDAFGFSVAISGDTIAVGAPSEDAAGESSGAVYVFRRDAGGAGNWGQVKKLVADDAAARDEFGFAVAIDADTIAAGAPFAGGNSGSAYVFERALGGAESWGQAKRLRADDADAGDQFGYAVAISADSILVGARFATVWIEIPQAPVPGDPSPGPILIELDDAGAAYFFERDAGGAGKWGQKRRRIADNAQAGDQFGFAVALRGDYAVVGAPVAGGRRGGRAYVHERDFGGRNVWGRLDRLGDSDTQRRDEFGFAVAIGGGALAVGAPETDAACPDDRDCDSGSAFVYTVTQTREQQACINALNLGLARISAARGKAFSRCAKSYARTGESAQACVDAPTASVERAEQAISDQEQKKCGEPAPSFGATDAATASDAAMQLESEVIQGLFGADLDAALATLDADRAAAKCQDAVIKTVDQCQQTKLRAFNRCKKVGLRSGAIRMDVDLEACWGDDPRGAIARACDPASGKLASRVLPRSCTSQGVDLAGAFPGCATGDPAAFARCADRVVECGVCSALNQADALALDCDLLDDGVANASCP